MLEHDFLFQYNTAHPVNCCRYAVAVEFPDVLVSIGTVVVTCILMESEVEFGSMLDHSNVQ